MEDFTNKNIERAKEVEAEIISKYEIRMTDLTNEHKFGLATLLDEKLEVLRIKDLEITAFKNSIGNHLV